MIVRLGIIPALVGSALLFGCSHVATPADTAGQCIVAASADVASRIFEAAQFHKDADRLRHFLAPGYVFVHASGKVGDGEDFVRSFEDRREVFTAFNITHRSVLEVGSGGAVIAAEAVVSGLRAGAPFRQHFRYADVYAASHGNWCVVYTQVTLLTD